MRIKLLLSLLICCCSLANAQQADRYVFTVVEPYFNNPAFVGYSGYTSITLNYRQQWSGIEGAPTTGTLLFQLPLSQSLSTGINFSNDEQGLLNTMRANLALGYRIYFGQRASTNHMLGFGLSGGTTRTTIDVNSIENLSDPALGNIYDNTYTLTGRFGLYYKFKNLVISGSLPQLFKPEFISDELFQPGDFDPLNTIFTSISYSFQVSPSVTFEPWFIYQQNEDFEDQIRGAATVHISNLVWFGGSYDLEQGASFHLGLNIGKKLRTGYGYELASTQTPELGQGTHEFLLSFRPGVKDKLADRRPGNEPEELITEENKVEPETETIKEETKPVETEAPKIEEPVEEIVIDKEPEIQQPIEEEIKEELPVEEEIIEQEVVEEEPITPEPEIEISRAHPSGMEPGFYVVVGAFGLESNAKKHMQNCINAGFSAKIGFDQRKNFYYVYLERAENQSQAANFRNKIRNSNQLNFKEAWILVIE